MSRLFNENSDSDTELKINTGYATNYNNWRQKEELNKLKTKYGDVSSDSGSSEDDSGNSSNEEDTELKEKFDKEFYKTLACLKNKDPKIYKKDVCFFEDTNKTQEQRLEKKKLGEDSEKEKSVFLRDYERKIIIEKEGKFSDSEDEETIKQRQKASTKLTYVQEQQRLKESFKNAVLEEEAPEGDDLLKPKTKSEAEKQQEEAEYKEWLKGNRLEIDKNQEKELRPLRDFWNNPNLDANEKFLRDYILDNKYLAENGSGVEFHHGRTAQDSDENFSEDEKNIEEQEEFEHKYNFRFEEPDKDFIKRYPRTMENTMRKKDTRRAQKRAEVKKRKEEEKLKKKQELLQLKALKRKEIEEKIEKLKEITGNNDIEFNTVDLDADFDPTEHDKKMMEIFNDDYYATAEDEVKPEFPDIDEELGIERTWDTYDPNTENVDGDDFEEPHCEDPEFNMDADYDESKAQQQQLIEDARPKKRRRRSKFAEVIAKEKPKFDPKQYKSYDEYFDKYYSLDYEDMIGDLPCRFKYRKVVPNDYGLSVEEILTADDKELNKWCSLKKALQYKPEHVEQNEVHVFKQMAKDEARKQRVLRSLYSSCPEEKDESENQAQDTSETTVNSAVDNSRKKKRRKKKHPTDLANEDSKSSAVNTVPDSNNEKSKNDSHNRQVKRKAEANEQQLAEKRPRRENVEKPLPATDKPQEFNNKPKKKRTSIKDGTVAAANSADQTAKLSESSKKKSKSKGKFIEKRRKGVTRNGKLNVNNEIISMDAQRLKTYGISGKKLKKKLKAM